MNDSNDQDGSITEYAANGTLDTGPCNDHTDGVNDPQDDAHAATDTGTPPALTASQRMRRIQDNVPAKLQALPQWAIAKSATDKVPRYWNDGKLANSSTTDPRKWMAFDDALNVAEFNDWLIGFVVTEGNDLTCIDLDVKDSASRDKKTGELLPTHQWTSKDEIDTFADILDQANSYAEVSTSGKGLHIWVTGELEGTGRKSGGYEIYSTKRFLICTGDVASEVAYDISDDNAVTLRRTGEQELKPLADGEDITETVLGHIDREKPREPAKSDALTTPTSAGLADQGEVTFKLPDESDKATPEDLNDEDRALLEKAFSAGNGDGIKAHYDADLTIINKDTSKADASFMQLLVIYTRDEKQLTRIWLSSALGKRDKVAVREDYRLRTIRHAITNYEREKFKSVSQVGFDAKNKTYNYDQMFTKGISWASLGVTNGAANDNSRIQVYSVDEMNDLPPGKERVKGVMTEQGIGAIYGAPGDGKSFLAFDMLACIASGRDWFGHRVKQAPVVFVAFEGVGGLPARVKAHVKEHGKPEAMKIITASGLNLLKDSDYKQLLEAIRPCLASEGVVCIDTLAASAPGIDENSSEGMGSALQQVKLLQSELGGVVMVVHHSGKDRSKGLRGWSGLNAAMDFSIEVSREHDKPRQLRLQKVKDGEDGATQEFELKNVHIGYDEDGENRFSCVVHRVDINHRLDWDVSELHLLAAIRQNPNPKSQAEWGILAGEAWMKDGEGDRRRISETVKKMITKKLIEHKNKTYTLTDAGIKLLPSTISDTQKP